MKVQMDNSLLKKLLCAKDPAHVRSVNLRTGVTLLWNEYAVQEPNSDLQKVIRGNLKQLISGWVVCVCHLPEPERPPTALMFSTHRAQPSSVEWRLQLEMDHGSARLEQVLRALGSANSSSVYVY